MPADAVVADVRAAARRASTTLCALPNDVVRGVFDGLGGPTQVIEYPEGWHLLFRDLQAETVWKDVAEWTLAQSGPECEEPKS